MADHEARKILEVCRDIHELSGDETMEIMMDDRRLILQYDWRSKALIWAIATIPPHADDGSGMLHGEYGPMLFDVLERALRK